MKGMQNSDIYISYEKNEYKKIINKKQAKNWIQNVFSELNLFSSSCSIVLTDNNRIIEFNEKYFSKQYKTDVISFSQIEGEKADFIGSDFLGDIIISVEFAIDYANEKKHSVQLEVKYLILHGILHLLGYDHEKDNGEMTELQNKIFNKLTGVKIG